ncbi:MAG: UDP-N-acetylmuramate--L-alanine ligase [Oligoflexales bacterium]|nr:UDP-N-acetylmuramate--L-alanine ligase [Oligoflexales bacterium]
MLSLAALKRVHFVGIGGSGMLGLAQLSLETGLSVSGSENKGLDSLPKKLAERAKIFPTHLAENIIGADAVVYSSAIQNDNPEMIAARQNNIPLLHRSQFLQLFLDTRKAIVVAGTHGKTSTSALIYHMLKGCGIDAGLYLGGKLKPTGLSAALGSSEYFVVEADESDGSFLNFRPFIAVVTNLEADHMDYYQTIDNLHATFEKFMQGSDQDGFCIVGWDHRILREISECISDRRLSFGTLLGSEVRPLSHSDKDGCTTYNIIVNQQQVQGKIDLVGAHNILNVSAALSVAACLNLNLDKATKALASYPGVERRFSYLYKSEQLYIIDDYAHNPGKIKSVVQAVKKSWSDFQLIVVFQPHRFTRFRTLYSAFLESFDAADLTIVTEVYGAGEAPDPSLNAMQFVNDLKQRNQNLKASSCSDLGKLSSLISKQLSKKSVILFVGAGDIDFYARNLAEELI